MKLTELFNSFQGEGVYTGWPMTFIRVTGCPVGCPFCDTDYTYGEPRELEQICRQVTHNRVCITGGEPLAHPEIEDLIEAVMHVSGLRKIHIETSGCYEIPHIVWQARKFFWITVSPKGEFLGAKKNFRPSMLEDADEVKWIYPGTPKHMIKEYMNLNENTFIQPLNSKLAIDDDSLTLASDLARELDLPLSVQLHKLLEWR